MKRKFTIKIKDNNGVESVGVFHSKRRAAEYCRKVGALKGKFEIELIVQYGTTVSSETIVRENY
jgi:hypothetical protein